jgi:hypothetical protein
MNSCNIVYILLAISIILWLFYNYNKYSENFDITGSKFVAEGEPRYDLRGVKIDTIPTFCAFRRNMYYNQDENGVWVKNYKYAPHENIASTCAL